MIKFILFFMCPFLLISQENKNSFLAWEPGDKQIDIFIESKKVKILGEINYRGEKYKVIDYSFLKDIKNNEFQYYTLYLKRKEKFEGKYIMFTDNDTMKPEITFEYRKNKLHGKVIYFTTDGEISIEKEYFYGKKIGVDKIYVKSKKLNKFIKVVFRYYSNDKLIREEERSIISQDTIIIRNTDAEINYKNGKLHGLCRFGGGVECEFENGKLVGLKEFLKDVRKYVDEKTGEVNFIQKNCKCFMSYFSLKDMMKYEKSLYGEDGIKKIYGDFRGFKKYFKKQKRYYREIRKKKRIFYTNIQDINPNY